MWNFAGGSQTLGICPAGKLQTTFFNTLPGLSSFSVAQEVNGLAVQARIFAGLVRQATKKRDRETRSPSAFSKTVVQTIHMSDCWISTPLNHLSTEILVPYLSLTGYLRQLEPLLFHHKQHPFRNQQYHKHRCRHMGHSRSAQGGRQRVERSVSW